jgi:GNAT superfamily N-acetyltransferase
MNEQIVELKPGRMDDAYRSLARQGAAAGRRAAEFQRITDAGKAELCDLLFREFFDWVVEQLRSLHGLALAPSEVEAIHLHLRTDWPRFFVDPGRMFLSTVDGEPAGVGILKPVAAGAVELKRMYVRPRLRGLRLGRRMLDLLIAEARTLGFRQMRLETFAFMKEAVSIYRSVGFVEVPQFEGFEGASHSWGPAEIFMNLDLGAGAEDR